MIILVPDGTAPPRKDDVGCDHAMMCKFWRPSMTHKKHHCKRQRATGSVAQHSRHTRCHHYSLGRIAEQRLQLDVECTFWPPGTCWRQSSRATRRDRIPCVALSQRQGAHNDVFSTSEKFESARKQSSLSEDTLRHSHGDADQ